MYFFVPKVETIKRVISPDKLERNISRDNKVFSQYNSGNNERKGAIERKSEIGRKRKLIMCKAEYMTRPKTNILAKP